MNLKLSRKNGFYSCETLKQEINNFKIIFLTFWTCMHLPNFITLCSCDISMYTRNKCYNVSIFAYVNTERK